MVGFCARAQCHAGSYTFIQCDRRHALASDTVEVCAEALLLGFARESTQHLCPSQMSLVPLSLLSLSIRAAALVLGLLKTSSLLGPNLKLAAF